MNRLERMIHSVRHSRLLENSDWLWNRLRNPYEKALSLKRSGLKRNINGSDPILISSAYRQLPDEYEPELWQALMRRVQVGDVVVDVGAYVGIYSVALAKRVGDKGRVIAVEPDPENFSALVSHVRLNGVDATTSCIQKAVGRKQAPVRFKAGRSVESAVTTDETGSIEVAMTTLDEITENSRVDLVKVDVEGHELDVMGGASGLLADRSRRPRAFFIELHQFAWNDPAAYEKKLVNLFESAGYRLSDVTGEAPGNLQTTRWLVAAA